MKHFLFTLTMLATIFLQAQSIDIPEILNLYNQKIELSNTENKLFGNHEVREDESGMNLPQTLSYQQQLIKTDFASLNKSGQKNLDTLFVGVSPGDSVYITGSFFNNGPVFVLNDGILVFENADALIQGDIYVWGDQARVEISNSTMSFPQLYIYQRSLVAAGGGHIDISNSHLNFSGLQNNLVATDSATVFWENVTKSGFTTCGLSSRAQVEMINCDAAEFVMLHNAHLHIEQSTHMLIWHHIPDTASMDISFPDGAAIVYNEFTPPTPGLTNIFYSYVIDDCTDIMWGLMPEPGSDVTISDSELRTIGVWFRDQLAYDVSGLVNNSYYSNFMAPLSSHQLHLINTHVTTWSLYMFIDSEGEINNCILGEIGLFENSSVTVNNSMIDGSGGYVFAEANSFIIMGFSYLNCDFHLNDQSIGFLVYGGQNWGRSIAKDKSIMIVLQSNLPQLPEYYDDAMVWYIKLEGSNIVYADSLIPLYGSVWIDKASSYFSTEMAWYELHYRQNESDPWIPISVRKYQKVYSDELCEWNTDSINPGTYFVKLTMCDNTVDSNKVEVVKAYTMLPSIASVDEYADEPHVSVFPNPFVNTFTVENNYSAHIINLIMYNVYGKPVLKKANSILKKHEDILLQGEHLPAGQYYLHISFSDGTFATLPMIKQ